MANGTLAFKTLLGAWTAGDEGTYVDAVVVENPSAELVRLAAHAHDAGVIEVTEGLDDSHIQSQQDGEAALAEAMGEWDEENQRWTGGWHEGNLAVHDLTQAQLAHESALGAHAAAVEGGDQEEVDAAQAALDEAAANLAAVDADVQRRVGA